MSTYSTLNVPTRFVQADAIRFAYGRWGQPDEFPLVFMQYFSANLDDWDPLVTDGFAADYDVILFNNAGVASSRIEYCVSGMSRGPQNAACVRAKYTCEATTRGALTHAGITR
jgi:hypothetical protein